MKPVRTLAIASLSLLVSAALTQAAPATYKIDPNHSDVAFSIRHLVSNVQGRFKTYEGEITVDPDDLAKTRVRVSIDAGSIDTGVANRDKHLVSPDFFDAAKFPKLTFVSTEVIPGGPHKATVKGNLTIKGVTKPVSLEAEILGFVKDPWGNYRGGFKARTTLNRQDFGVSWNKVLEGGGTLLGNEVEVTLNVEAVREAPQKAPKEVPSGKN